MKKNIFTLGAFVVLVSFSSVSCGQNQTPSSTEKGNQNNTGENKNPLKIKTSSSELYTTDNPKTFFMSLTASGHDLAMGDEIDAVNVDNKRLNFKITNIKNDNGSTVLKNGEYGMVDLELLNGNVFDLGGDFYLVDKGAAFPTDAAETKPEKEKTTSTKSIVTVDFNGMPWTGEVTYQGALFYAKGVSVMDKSGKPYMQLAFKSTTKPDDRQLTIQVRDFSGKAGKVNTSQVEVMLTGSATGDTKKPDMVGYKNIAEYKGYFFELDVLEFTQEGNTTFLTATFTAKLKGIFGSKDVELSNGKITKLPVTVFNEKY